MSNYLFIVYYWWTKLNNTLEYLVKYKNKISGWPSEDVQDNLMVDEGKSMIYLLLLNLYLELYEWEDYI